jgi:hypothetical protein
VEDSESMEEKWEVILFNQGEIGTVPCQGKDVENGCQWSLLAFGRFMNGNGDVWSGCVDCTVS